LDVEHREMLVLTTFIVKGMGPDVRWVLG